MGIGRTFKHCLHNRRIAIGVVPVMSFVLLAMSAALTVLGGAADARAQIVNPGSYEKLRQDAVFKVKNRLSPALLKYCKEACQIIAVDVEIEETVGETEDLGFEGVVGDDLGESLFVSKVVAAIQIDDRVTSANRERLRKIVLNSLRGTGLNTDVTFLPVTMPQIGASHAIEEQLKQQVRRDMGAAIDKVIHRYCPDSCVLSQIAVDGELVTPDEAQDVPPLELERHKGGDGILRIDAVDIEVAIDETMDEGDRRKIENLLRARTKFRAPVSLDISTTEFPESYAQKSARLQSESQDPFGLERLKQTLKIFRELAGTKEIITNSTVSSDRQQSVSQSSEKSSRTRDEINEWNQNADEGIDLLGWALIVGGLLVLAGLITILVMRMTNANRDARLMTESVGERNVPKAAPDMEPPTVGATSDPNGLNDDTRGQIAQRLRAAELREELVRIFLEAPKVAKETFSRLLQEEGVEDTAKYVHLFGHMVVFELLNDPNLSRDLYELTEYYHKSDFDFDLDEEVGLLQTLKTRVVASEIRVLTRKRMEKFDFLSKLDATQIFNLIQDEKPQMQSIVLTQLDHKRRRAVFEMYEGEAKVDLMRELCRADAIPKDYLVNVAQALQKKVTSRPEFDTENLRSSDILLDLLEKANLSEQRALMNNLMQTNAEAARAIKLKLVTVEMLPYLKDGHLLEIVMGLDRDDLLTFLAGARDHIRGLLLTKAPEELADSWIEDLENKHGIDEQAYRLTEMKILGRIRSLANHGAVNLLDINDLIFGDSSAAEEAPEGEAGLDLSSEANLVA